VRERSPASDVFSTEFTASFLHSIMITRCILLYVVGCAQERLRFRTFPAVLLRRSQAKKGQKCREKKRWRLRRIYWPRSFRSRNVLFVRAIRILDNAFGCQKRCTHIENSLRIVAVNVLFNRFVEVLGPVLVWTSVIDLMARNCG